MIKAKACRLLSAAFALELAGCFIVISSAPAEPWPLVVSVANWRGREIGTHRLHLKGDSYTVSAQAKEEEFQEKQESELKYPNKINTSNEEEEEEDGMTLSGAGTTQQSHTLSTLTFSLSIPAQFHLVADCWPACLCGVSKM